MTLTNEQLVALRDGKAVPLMIDGILCVALRRENYERLTRFVDDAMDPEEGHPTMLEAWDATGSVHDAADYAS